MSPAWGEAAGSVVASAGDMLRFWHAVLTGKLHSLDTTRRRFQNLYPMFDAGTFYGQGVMVYDAPGVLWLGHSGGTPGAKAVVAYSPADQTFVAVAINTDGPAEAVANLMLQRWREAGGD
jgi:D-alanyl-D-alanine carboxypeptidase